MTRPSVEAYYVVRTDEELSRLLRSIPLKGGEKIVRTSDYSSPTFVRSVVSTDPRAKIVAVTPPTLKGKGAVTVTYYKVRSEEGREVLIDKITGSVRTHRVTLPILKASVRIDSDCRKEPWDL